MSTIKTDIIIWFLISGNFIFPKYKDSITKPLNSCDSFDNTNVYGLSLKSQSFISKGHPDTNDYGIRKKHFSMRAGQYPW